MEKTNEIMTLAQNFTLGGVPAWAVLATISIIIMIAVAANVLYMHARDRGIEDAVDTFREMPNRQFRRWKQDL